MEGTGRFALELGYTVTLVKDATAASTKEWMHAAVELNAPIYAESVLSTAEVIARIRWHDWRHIRRAVYSPRSELSLARRSGTAQPGVDGCGAGLGVQASDGDLQVRALIGPLEVGDVRLDLLQVENAPSSVRCFSMRRESMS